MSLWKPEQQFAMVIAAMSCIFNAIIVLGMMSSACSPKSPGKPEFCPISASFTKN
jgi:hypothetical protein